MSFINALKWSFLAELATKLVQPLLFIVLAWFLTPEDFGVMTAALMVIAFTQIFWEAGTGKALIQRQSDMEAAANAAFWINILLGVIVAALLYVLSLPIASLIFQDERVALVLKVMVFQVFLGAISSVPTALLQKEMAFKKLFLVRFVTVILPGFATVPLAINGGGYWALVIGGLVGQAAQTVVIYYVVSWRPSFNFSGAVAKEIAKFGMWVSISGVLGWLYVWADSLIVGAYFGSHELGVYRVGNQISLLLFVVVFGSLMPVFYSHIVKSKSASEVRESITRGIDAIALVSVTMGVALFAFSNTLSELFFSQEWTGLGEILGVMGLTFGLTYVVSLNGEVYRALNVPSKEALVMVIAIAIYLPIYFISAKYGMTALLWARFIAGGIGVLLQLYVLKLCCGVEILPILAKIFKVLCFSSIFFMPYKIFSQHISNIYGVFLIVALTVLYLMSIYFWGRKIFNINLETSFFNRK